MASWSESLRRHRLLPRDEAHQRVHLLFHESHELRIPALRVAVRKHVVAVHQRGVLVELIRVDHGQRIVPGLIVGQLVKDPIPPPVQAIRKLIGLPQP